jgi:hypothetical protein
MKEKIEWYQEVLELEPSSKVFFPLARLLAENGRFADAASALRQGLDRHPEHFEAQMLFLEMLVRTNRDEEAEELARDVARTTSGYPTFWRKWAEALAAGENGMESSLAVSFLAARFDGNRISWGEVIRLGLSAATDGKVSQESPAVLDRNFSSEIETDDFSEEPEPEESELEELEGTDEDDSDLPEFTFDAGEEGASGFFESEEEAAALVSESGDGEGALEVSVLSSGFEEGDLENDSQEDEDVEGEGEGEESFSLRTMTMAGLLADQGDCRGALAIYKEFWSEEPVGPRKERLGGLIAEMESRLAEAASPEQGKGATGKRQAGSEGAVPDVAKGLDGKKKLMTTLEALADRLDDRATGQD